ncbi:MAG: DUF4157 domain-containing protein, partial [Deltaproteobacteria bacterium]|nr:DUF4157 domain-containing protein [Deltaproteobacteria bacterium]
MRETTSGFDQANDSSGATPAVAGKGASVAALIQRRGGGAAATSEASEAPEAIDAFVASTRGGGSRLSGGVLQKMNSAFAQDFGGVGIHTDATSAEACRAMGAQAFTVGSDVYFDQGKFDPGSREGQQLLGHELTHVVQQGGGRAAGAQARLAVGASDDPLEQEADAMGDKAAAGEAPGAAAGAHDGAAPGADGAAA